MALSSKNARAQSPNRLLASLPAAVYQRIFPKFEKVSLGLKGIAYQANKPIEHVFFPLNGVISIVTYMKDGTAIEVATVGNEGMLGLPIFFGVDRTPLDAFQQIPGESLKMSTDDFTNEISRDSPMWEIINRYTQTFVTQIAQGNACNRVHSIEQRCARWLLMTHDRVGKDEYLLTQEFLSQMLGLRRASVNAVATNLKKEGMIDYRRGVVRILDRRKIEKRACECYWIVRNEFDRLFEPVEPD